ncbi:hypothetical protein G6F56_007742 [Rhizopus delemar]|nr:hypothetical protein G6F56_007742 [Rhizopus delemar]
MVETESLVPNGTTPVQDNFEKDYQHVAQYLETNTPSYVFVRLDEKASTGEYNWLFLSYVPDNAKVRDKMLYASTRATLTKELGDYRFVENFYGTDKIAPEEFAHTIQEINTRMDYADRLSWRVAIHQLHAFIDSENQNIYHLHQLSISDPIEINFYEQHM